MQMWRLILFFSFIPASCLAQLNLLRFATFYASYTTNTPQIMPTSFEVEGIPPDNPWEHVDNFVDGELVETTQINDPNIVITLGLRKIARFDYQRKQNNFYTGNEHEASDYATISNAPGLEYLLQYSFNRNNGVDVSQQEYNIRYISNIFTAKANYVDNRLIDLKYTLGEVRLRKSFGSLDFTFGVAHRSHPVYGCNPMDDYQGTWEEFAISEMYLPTANGIWMQITDNGPEWIAGSDNEFYKYHFGRAVNNYNKTHTRRLRLTTRGIRCDRIRLLSIQRELLVARMGFCIPHSQRVNGLFLPERYVKRRVGYRFNFWSKF